MSTKTQQLTDLVESLRPYCSAPFYGATIYHCQGAPFRGWPRDLIFN